MTLIAGVGLSSAANGASLVTTRPKVVLVTIEHAGFRDVLNGDARVLALASSGGAGLVSQRLPLGDAIRDAFGAGRSPFAEVDLGSVAGPGGGVDRVKLHAVFDRLETQMDMLGSTQVTLILVSRSPSLAGAAGDELGVIVMASGTGTQIAEALGSSAAAGTAARALTSDSTRRDGVVTTSDIAVTIASLSGTRVPTSVAGAVIRAAAAPVPFDLYQRYLDQRRLTVPIGVVTGIYVTIAGLFALAVAWQGVGTSGPVRAAAAWGAISILPLGSALLEVGRFPRLEYPVVIPFLIGVTAVGATVTVVAAHRYGAVRAVVWLGSAVLAVLAFEAAQGWPGAVTPLLGGSQLDGGRFFGVPNAFIGLVLGSAVSVALGRRRVWAGAALLFGVGLVVGSPWTGSDLGGAITMCAASGLWLGLRSSARLLRTMLMTGVAALAGAALVVLTQRYLASSPTHITRFAEGAGHAGGIVGTMADRLRIGLTLVATHPFALVPVAGVPVALWIVLRPGPRLDPVLRAEPAFTAAIITILVGSIVAYMANDTGASALGLGFGSAVSALFFVMLSVRRQSPVPA